jgi:hypothetical protein
MNKSTPLNQLPANTELQGNFINEQQKHMITQAQAAIGNATFPQNTQISSDIMNDDDPAIQEVLNQFQQSQPQHQTPSQATQQMDYLQQQQLFAQLQQQQQQQQLSSVPSVPPPSSSSILNTYMSNITDDIKLVVLVFVIYIIVQFIPIEKLIGRYLAIDKIPYHHILLRAILAAVFFMFLKKLMA